MSWLQTSKVAIKAYCLFSFHSDLKNWEQFIWTEKVSLIPFFISFFLGKADRGNFLFWNKWRYNFFNDFFFFVVASAHEIGKRHFIITDQHIVLGLYVKTTGRGFKSHGTNFVLLEERMGRELNYYARQHP